MGLFSRKPKLVADPNCPRCHGKGQVEGGGQWMETCSCVTRLAQEATDAQQERLQGLRTEVGRLRAKRDADPYADPGWRNEQARQAVHNPVTPYEPDPNEGPSDAVAGVVTFCCDEPVCRCGQNLWAWPDGHIRHEKPPQS